VSATLDDLVSLALFARVVEARSFTEAARRLDLSKSVVSARLSRFEERLGVRLLHRTTRRLSLTDAGLAVYERAMRMLSEADEAARTGESAGAEPRGLLRVNAPVTYTQIRLAPLIPEFLRLNPAVTLELTCDDRAVNLVEAGCDVAIRVQISRLKDSSVVARKLCSDELLICAAPAYLERAGTPRRPADLVHHACLRYSSVPRGGDWGFRGPDGPYFVPVSGALISSDAQVLREAALAGLGLIVLPRFMVDEDLAAGRLRTVLEGTRRAGIGVYALLPHRQVSAHVRAFVDFLAARLGPAAG
jgi:DNA-binding transcriptional LysR family regulator